MQFHLKAKVKSAKCYENLKFALKLYENDEIRRARTKQPPH